MLTLYLLRHAKAAGAAGEGDVLRELAERGQAEAEQLGAYMAGNAWRPDLALVSTATRTSQTFEYLQLRFGAPIPARFELSLYNATSTQILGVLRAVEADAKSVIVVGHNPGIAEAAAILARSGDAAEIRALRQHFPPCAIARIAFDATDWRDAVASGGRLDDFVIPEHLVSPR